MKVGDVLRKKSTRIATVRMNETVAIAAQLLRTGNISALVVKDVCRTEGNTAWACSASAMWSAPLPSMAPPVSISRSRR
jgi:hypothetical protein